MNKLEKIAIVILSLDLLIFSALLVIKTHAPANLGGGAVVTETASSTAFSITTTSKRILATSTKRAAILIQPTNCTNDGVTYLNLGGKDAAATIGAGYAIFASTSVSFDDNNVIPDMNSVQAVVSTGTCTVLVTEQRTNF